MYNVDPNDPLVLTLAQVFLEGFQKELVQKQALLEYMNTEEGKQFFSMFASEVSRHYERNTLEEQSLLSIIAAIGVGAAAAIQYALATKSGTPTPPT